jgi:hypothetical protein
MGYHIILTCTSTIKAEYINFINRDYFSMDYPIENIPEEYHDIVDHWRNCNLESFSQFDLSGNEFTFQIYQKVTTYEGDLEDAYKYILKYVIAPITTFISECTIEHDDYGCGYYVLYDEDIRKDIDMTYSCKHCNDSPHRYIHMHRLN